MDTKANKLVVFDIDGTLIKTARLVDNLQRFRYGIQKVYGIDVGPFDEERWNGGNYNGTGDRYILWDLVRPHGVTRDTFVDRIGEVGEALAEYLEMIKDGGPSYIPIPEAKELVRQVVDAPHLSEGILTGNMGPSAAWKLASTGFPAFAFGVYGHEADARDDLARLLVPKAAAYFGHTFSPGDIVIIGDTISDLLCAKAIGATSVIVSTGWNINREEIEKAGPDLLIDTLMDERLRKLLGL